MKAKAVFVVFSGTLAAIGCSGKREVAQPTNPPRFEQQTQASGSSDLIVRCEIDDFSFITAEINCNKEKQKRASVKQIQNQTAHMPETTKEQIEDKGKRKADIARSLGEFGIAKEIESETERQLTKKSYSGTAVGKNQESIKQENTEIARTNNNNYTGIEDDFDEEQDNNNYRSMQRLMTFNHKLNTMNDINRRSTLRTAPDYDPCTAGTTDCRHEQYGQNTFNGERHSSKTKQANKIEYSAQKYAGCIQIVGEVGVMGQGLRNTCEHNLIVWHSGPLGNNPESRGMTNVPAGRAVGTGWKTTRILAACLNVEPKPHTFFEGMCRE